MYYKSLSLSHTHPLSFSQGEIVVNVKDALLVQAFLSGVVVFLPTTKNLVFGVCVVFPKITFYHIFFSSPLLTFVRHSNIPIFRSLAACSPSRRLYLSLLADKDLMDTNSQFKLYQNLRYFALFERNLVEAEMYTDELESQFPWHNGPLVKAFLELSREVLSNTDTGQTAEVLKHAEKLLRKAVVYSKKRNDSNRSTLNELAAILKRVLLKRAMMDKVLVQYPRPQSANTTATPTMRRTGGWESGGRDVDTAQVGHVDYLDPADFTNMDEFYTAYLGWNRPVIIGKGLMEEWPAMTEWTRDKLSRPGPRSDIEVITGKTPYPKKMGFPVIKTSIWEFIDKNMGNESERALRFEEGGGHFLYMFQEMHTAKEAEASRKLMEEETPKEYVQSDEGNTMEKGGAEMEMLKAIESQRTSEGLLQNWTTLMSDYEFPPHFSFPTSLRWMRDKVPPPVKHFFVGPRGSGTHAHAHQNAFNALIYGRKRWILIPPEYNLATVDEGDMQKNAPIRGFLKNVLPQLIKQKIDYIDIIQEPGEFIFVPDMWTHAIYNLEDSVGVAYQIGRPTKEWNYEMLEEDYPMNFVPKKQ